MREGKPCGSARVSRGSLGASQRSRTGVHMRGVASFDSWPRPFIETVSFQGTVKPKGMPRLLRKVRVGQEVKETEYLALALEGWSPAPVVHTAHSECCAREGGRGPHGGEVQGQNVRHSNVHTCGRMGRRPTFMFWICILSPDNSLPQRSCKKASVAQPSY